ncbi:MAG: GntR family transcriptional regulator [Pseudonocardiales bacterium]|nr:GntR family transcriptional regulator [Pseudonocardiales bacterium]
MILNLATEPRWMAVSRELRDRIVRGDYAPGSNLPTEAQLGSEFGVSRTVVRESVKVLTEKGLLRIDRGNGTLVTPASDWRNFDPEILSSRLQHGDKEKVLHELFVLRRALEPELTAIAAERADDLAIARIGAAVDRLERAKGRPDEYLIADGLFHSAIAETAGVALALEFFRVMNEPLALARQVTNRIPGAIEKAHEHHLKIFSCIRAQDVEAGRQAMREHICWADARLSQAI